MSAAFPCLVGIVLPLVVDFWCMDHSSVGGRIVISQAYFSARSSEGERQGEPIVAWQNVSQNWWSSSSSQLQVQYALIYVRMCRYHEIRHILDSKEADTTTPLLSFVRLIKHAVKSTASTNMKINLLLELPSIVNGLEFQSALQIVASSHGFRVHPKEQSP